MSCSVFVERQCNMRVWYDGDSLDTKEFYHLESSSFTTAFKSLSE